MESDRRLQKRGPGPDRRGTSAQQNGEVKNRFVSTLTYSVFVFFTQQIPVQRKFLTDFGPQQTFITPIRVFRQRYIVNRRSNTHFLDKFFHTEIHNDRTAFIRRHNRRRN